MYQDICRNFFPKRYNFFVVTSIADFSNYKTKKSIISLKSQVIHLLIR